MPWQTETTGTSQPAAPPIGACPYAQLRPVGAAEREAHVAQASGTPRLWPWVAGAALLSIGVGAALLLEHFSRVTATLAPGVAGAPMPAAAAPFNPAVLAWPGAAVVVILAAYFGLRALTADRRGPHRVWHTAGHPR